MEGDLTVQETKISVIVPVYKVEAYLEQCLESLLRQTHRALQIILVDDGSPDGCGAICDDYARRDDRITVIHKENGGLSSARNAGMALADGAYIGFLDSDDWIEPDMFEYLLDEAQRSGADITMCAFTLEMQEGSQKYGYDAPHRFDRTQAMGELLKNAEMTNNVWNKLYRRPLFDGVRFPDGHVYEDLATTYRVYERAALVSVLPESKYHYRLNPKGIVMSRSIPNQVDYWRGAKQRYLDLRGRYPEYVPLMEASLVGAAMEMWSRVWPERNTLSADVRALLREMAAFSRTHYKTALRVGAYGITGRLRIALTPYDTRASHLAAYLLWRIYALKHQAQSI